MGSVELDPLESDRVAARVAAAVVLGIDGSRLRVRELWRDAPTVTTFLRHYGCLFCHQMVAEVILATPELIARGARVVLIGNGSVEQAHRFFTAKGLPREGCTVVTDPERSSYQAAELERGFAKTFLNAGSQRAFLRARRDGHGISGWLGDLTQLGGTLVTRPPARLQYFHRSEFAGDHPDMSLVARAVDAALCAHGASARDSAGSE